MVLWSFSPDWISHISILGFLPIGIAFDIWGDSLSNSIVVIYSDFLAEVHDFNKTSSRDAALMQLIRRFMILSLKKNKTFAFEPNIFRVSVILLLVYFLVYRFCNSILDSSTWNRNACCGPCSDNSLTKKSKFLLFKFLSPATISPYKSAFQSYNSFVLNFVLT